MQFWQLIKELQTEQSKKYVSESQGNCWFIERVGNGEIACVYSGYNGKRNEHIIPKELLNLDLEWEVVEDNVSIKTDFQNAVDHNGQVRLEDKSLNRVYKECESLIGFGIDSEEEYKEDLLTLQNYLNGEFDFMHNIMTTITPYCDHSLLRYIFTEAKWYLDDRKQ